MKKEQTEKIISLGSPVTDIKGVGPKKAAALARLGIRRLSDILDAFPRAYEDYRNVYTIERTAREKPGDRICVKGLILGKYFGRGFGRKRTLRLLVDDGTGRMEVLFFNAGYLAAQFEQNSVYSFFGTVKVENGRVTMFHPTHAKDAEGGSGIQPVYRLVSGVSQKDMRRLSKLALSMGDEIAEDLPESVLTNEKLCGIDYAYRNLHYPEDENRYGQARYRMIFGEFFYLRLALLLSKDRFGSGRRGNVMDGDGGDEFIKSLPYELTGAQKRAWAEIRADMGSPVAMNRLVQGDVGSGKTVIAEAALAQAVKAGFQGIFMAPTEILAGQHFDTLSRDLGPLGARCALLTGSLPAAERRKLIKAIAEGEYDVIIGTHAVISESVKYRNPGLVITDEQHRFGVNQRRLLSEKGSCPDVMVMTATPIPRTLAVVCYGDLDVSVIDEFPPGRKPIKTMSYDAETRDKAYELLVSEVRSGRQAYVVAPFIEDSESVDGFSAQSLYEDFTSAHPDIPASLRHGDMSQQEKDRVMQDFYSGKVPVLISTVVIEVGIDVANATVMLVENCERFGLAQLHQLRGRVGRGKHESYCLLVLGEKSEIAEERVKTLCETGDGFVIAEKDLEMRGPGEIFGLRQHGLPQLQLADPVKHLKLSVKAGAAAEALLKEDPTLSSPENVMLKQKVADKFTRDESQIL